MKVKDLILLLLLAHEDTPVVFGLGAEEYPINGATLRITNVVWDGETPPEFTPSLPSVQVVLTP
jgi:hypothetical protein